MIKLELDGTYTAEIDGQVWRNIAPTHRFWAEVQAMIDAGAVAAQAKLTEAQAEELVDQIFTGSRDAN